MEISFCQHNNLSFVLQEYIKIPHSGLPAFIIRFKSLLATVSLLLTQGMQLRVQIMQPVKNVQRNLA